MPSHPRIEFGLPTRFVVELKPAPEAETQDELEELVEDVRDDVIRESRAVQDRLLAELKEHVEPLEEQVEGIRGELRRVREDADSSQAVEELRSVTSRLGAISERTDELARLLTQYWAYVQVRELLPERTPLVACLERCNVTSASDLASRSARELCQEIAQANREGNFMEETPDEAACAFMIDRANSMLLLANRRG